MIKLIASDLDGTIISSNNSISENNMKVIDSLQKKHIPLVICTGKTYAISKDICKDLHADFGIFGNGSQIINLSTGDEILRKALTFEEVESCFSVIQNQNLHIHAYTEDSIITPNLSYMDLRNSVLFPNKLKIETVNSVLDYIKTNNSSVLKLVISSPFSLSKLRNDLKKQANLTINHICKTGIYKDIIIDKEYEYLDISPTNVSKGTALEILSNYLNLKKENILSIGDNINDIDMFKVSNISAALNNASDEVKKFANYITENPVQDGGFAEAIYKYIPF